MCRIPYPSSPSDSALVRWTGCRLNDSFFDEELEEACEILEGCDPQQASALRYLDIGFNVDVCSVMESLCLFNVSLSTLSLSYLNEDWVESLASYLIDSRCMLRALSLSIDVTTNC